MKHFQKILIVLPFATIILILVADAAGLTSCVLGRGKKVDITVESWPLGTPLSQVKILKHHRKRGIQSLWNPVGYFYHPAMQKSEHATDEKGTVIFDGVVADDVISIYPSQKSPGVRVLVNNEVLVYESLSTETRTGSWIEVAMNRDGSIGSESSSKAWMLRNREKRK